MVRNFGKREVRFDAIVREDADIPVIQNAHLDAAAVLALKAHDAVRAEIVRCPVLQRDEPTRSAIGFGEGVHVGRCMVGRPPCPRRKDDGITCPRVYREYSGDTVLVMEFVRGVSVEDVGSLRACGYDLKETSSPEESLTPAITPSAPRRASIFQGSLV